VTTAETVAIIGSISTPVVALAGFAFNAWRAGQDRQAAARLAEQAQMHERQLTQGGRAYTDRGNAYRGVIGWALREIQQVELTMPIITFEGTPEPPASLPEDQWEAMMIEVRLFGSRAVFEAMNDFRDKVRGFAAHVMVQRTFREERVRGSQVLESWRELQASRSISDDVQQALDVR
jgi:hypothetical protein